MSKLSGVKHYRRYIIQGSEEKLYCPTYRGRNLLKTNFPPTPYLYPTADKAQQHALRHAKRKKRQVKRFNDNEAYRDKILARYSAMIIAKNIELEKQNREKDDAE